MGGVFAFVLLGLWVSLATDSRWVFWTFVALGFVVMPTVIYFRQKHWQRLADLRGHHLTVMKRWIAEARAE